MWIKFVSVTLCAILMAGCSLFTKKPQLQDDYAQLQPIPEELTKAYNQGLQLLQKEKYIEAEEHWQTVIVSWPDYPGIWTNLALTQLQLEQYSAALESNNKALELDAEFCPGLTLQGLLLRENGQFEEAIKHYQAALNCDPKNPDIAFNLGILYDLYLQDLGQALTYYEQAQSLFPEQHETLAMWIEDLHNRQPQRIAGETE